MTQLPDIRLKRGQRATLAVLAFSGVVCGGHPTTNEPAAQPKVVSGSPTPLTAKSTPPTPEPTPSFPSGAIVVDPSTCEGRTFGKTLPFGSTSVVVRGRDGDTCLIEVTLEVELGYTRQLCRVPVSFGTFAMLPFSSIELKTAFEKHCEVVSEGRSQGQ